MTSLFSNCCVLIMIIFEIYNLIEKFWSFVVFNSKKELPLIVNSKLLSFTLILFLIFSFIVFLAYKFLILFFKEKMTNLMSKIINFINVFLFLNRKLKMRTKIIHEHFLSIYITRRTRSGFT